jgi:hypothetical protein
VPGRPVSDASIGAGATLVAHNVDVRAAMNYDSHADADALAVGSVVAVGVAAAGNYSEGEHIAEIGEGATVTADSISLVAVGDNNTPFDYDASAGSAAANLGGNLAGSLAVNAMRNHTAVRIGDGANVTSAGRIDLLANLERNGVTFTDAGHVHSKTRAGEAAISGLAAAGAAGAGTITLSGDLTEASIGDGAVVKAANSVDVRAKTNQDFDNQAVGGSVSLVFAAAIGAGFNYTNSEARAQVDGSVDVSGRRSQRYRDHRRAVCTASARAGGGRSHFGRGLSRSQYHQQHYACQASAARAR